MDRPITSAPARLAQAREDRFEIAFVAGSQTCELQPEAAPPPASSARWLCDRRHWSGSEGRHVVGRRDSSCSSSSRFGRQLAAKVLDAGDVAAGPVEAGDKSDCDRVAADRRRRSESSWSPPLPLRCGTAAAAITATWRRDQIGRQAGQSIVVAVRPAIFDRHVLALDKAGFAQALAERRTNPLQLGDRH